MYTLLCYDKCTTCKKAIKFLDELGIEYVKRDIKSENPSLDELKHILNVSGIEINKLFNTSGQVYRQNNIKDKLKTMSDDEKLALLSSDGMLVKRPILFDETIAIVGKKEEAYEGLK